MNEGRLPAELLDWWNWKEKEPNVILYGPPGTGKTYWARRLAERIVEETLTEAEGLSSLEQKVRAVREAQATWYHAIAMALKEIREPAAVARLLENEWVLAKARVQGREGSSNVYGTVWTTLGSHCDPKSNVGPERRLELQIFTKDERGWRLNEDGEEFVRSDETFRTLEQTVRAERSRDPKENIRFVTFHQSFAYEDFVEGYRPDDEGEDGQIVFRVRPGLFQEICREAGERPRERFVLIIDEINRANISKVFGELITLLEADKRENLTLSLPYSQARFTIPKNLFVIGTMNTADRSIALIDVALRRRFLFIEMNPDEDALREHFKREAPPSDGREDWSFLFGVCPVAVFRELNRRIEIHLDRNHRIGHSYFWSLVEDLPQEKREEEAKKRLVRLWNFKIRPLLVEYFYGREDKLKEVIGEDLCVLSEDDEHRVLDIRTIKDAGDLARIIGTNPEGPESREAVETGTGRGG